MRGGGERLEGTPPLMDAANMVGVGQSAPEKGDRNKKSFLTSAAAPAAPALQPPRAVMIIISSRRPRPDACCQLRKTLVLPEPPAIR